MIANESFTPSPYRRFQIKDGATQKVREICCPKFYPDQIVHWMMILVLEPVFMRGMCETNCGSVPGRGAHYGKKHIEKWYKLDRKNTKYCAKLDIRKFYPSSKAPAVMQELRHVIKCKRMLRLCETVLNSSDGLPIGNYTSQWFANFLLQRLDHFIKEVLHIRYFVRYMDDMCLWASSKKAPAQSGKSNREVSGGSRPCVKGQLADIPDGCPCGGFSWIPILPRENDLAKEPRSALEAEGEENLQAYPENRQSASAGRSSGYELLRMAETRTLPRLFREVR